MNAQPATETIYDMLLPDPRTVEALRRVICERGAYIDVDGWLWVISANALPGSRWRNRRMLHVAPHVLIKVMESKQVEWNARAYCYKAASHA